MTSTLTLELAGSEGLLMEEFYGVWPLLWRATFLSRKNKEKRKNRKKGTFL